MAPVHPDLRKLLGTTPSELTEVLEEETLALLQALIRNACVNHGDRECQEIKSIQTLAAFLDKHGLTYQIHHPPDRPNRPSLIAEYRGSGGDGPRVMLGPGHVDVVPVNEKAWQVAPFEGRVVDGEVWGRGTIDMLNTVAAQAVAFVCLATSRVPLRGTLIFCAVSDEEAGGVDGAEFLMNGKECGKEGQWLWGERHPSATLPSRVSTLRTSLLNLISPNASKTDPILRDVFAADFCLTEFGGANLPDRHLAPTTTYFHVNGEKGMASLEVICKGTPGHGSMPLNGDNALVKAAGVVKCLADYWTPTLITPEWRNLMAASDAPWLVRACLTSAWFASPFIHFLLWVGHPLGPVAHALTRLTLSPNHMTGTLKSNVVPGTAVVEVDGRLMPGQDEGYLVRQVERALGRRRMLSGQYEIRVQKFFPATTSSVNTPLWLAMERAAGVLVPGVRFAHGLLTGATDSRFFRRHCGAVAYGTNLFGPGVTVDHLMKSIHGDNERIPVASLGLSVQYFLLTVMYMLGGAGEEEEKEKEGLPEGQRDGE